MPATDKPVLFGVGPNHCATRSIALALERLGFSVRHDHKANKLALETMTFGEHDVYLDGPLREHYRHLERNFPRARFLFTTREREEWITSRVIHVLRNRVIGDNPWREINTNRWRDEWERLHNEIPAYFASHPGKFLLIDLRTTANLWQPLCDFLGRPVPVPEEPFPRSGRGIDTLRQTIVALRAQQKAVAPEAAT